MWQRQVMVLNSMLKLDILFKRTEPCSTFKRHILIGLILALLLRLLSFIPIYIDDDEAWFTISASSMNSLNDYFRVSLDNKPPGTVWFYWAVAQVLGTSNLPRAARLCNILLLSLTAWILVEISNHFWKRNQLVVALLFFFGTAAGNPKLLAVTNESLMLFGISLAILLTWPKLNTLNLRPLDKKKSNSWRWVLAGALIGWVSLIKQTGIFFLLPLILAINTISEFFILFFSLTFVLALGAGIVGFEDFIQWTWIYPRKVLYEARRNLFSDWKDGLLNLFFICFAILPIVLLFFQNLFRPRESKKTKEFQIILAWFIAGVAAIATGKGLFPHYYLLVIPPICVLSVGEFSWMKRWQEVWLWGFYILSCLVAATPWMGLFWGNDLGYYSQLANQIRNMTSLEEKVFYWGGSPIPLAISGRGHLKGFITSRFAAPPYSTQDTEIQFRTEFTQNPPALVVDNHARGDNQFNYPIQTIPWFIDILKSQYIGFKDPALPWVVYYLHRNSSIISNLKTNRSSLSSLCFYQPDRIHQQRKSYALSMDHLRNTLRVLSWYDLMTNFRSIEQSLRSEFGNEILRSQCQNGGPTEIQLGLSDSPHPLYSTYPLYSSYLWDSRLWWIRLAIVEMQPVAFPKQSR